MKSKPRSAYLPLTHALGWIIGSALFISGASYPLFKHFLKKRHARSMSVEYALRSIIQTGPQKEALKTEYLAELLGISSDRPPSALSFDLENAKKSLLRSPLIARAEVKLVKPNTLYVDYTVRQPIAWLEDYDNVALDKEGFPFPFRPFFSPKNLTALYFGLGPFGVPALDPERPSARWGVPLQGKYVDLAKEVLQIVTDPKVASLFSVKRIDVSHAFAESYGTREIVLIAEDEIILSNEGSEAIFTAPRILRLSTKNYAQELGNYLKLRQQLLEEEKKSLASQKQGRLPPKIFDLRIQKLAFIEDTQPSRKI